MTRQPSERLWFRAAPLPLLAALLWAASACGGGDAMAPKDPGDDPDPPGPPTPVEVTSFTFLTGHWNTQGHYVDADGNVQPSEGQATVTVSLSGQAREEIWVGTRAGVTARSAAFIVESDNPGRHVVARADGQRGTFDVMEGSFSSSTIVVSPRSGSRPDGGGVRERFFAITDSSFEWTAERFDGATNAWIPMADRAYRRTASDPGLGWGDAPAPGCDGEAYRHFDFWTGSWDAGGADSRIELLLGGCVVKENWGGNVQGASYNMYDPRADQWTQVWTNANGGTLVLFGGLDEAGHMILTGPNPSALQRIEWTPVAADRVRQQGASSQDGGGTWTSLYDLTYRRR